MLEKQLHSFVFFCHHRSLRDSIRSKLVIGLSANHILLLIIFLSGVEETDDAGSCRAVAILLHYFLLATFCWMASSSYLLFIKIVLVMHAMAGNYVQRAAIFSQGDHPCCRAIS